MQWAAQQYLFRQTTEKRRMFKTDRGKKNSIDLGSNDQL
jgi:hypothetical protein